MKKIILFILALSGAWVFGVKHTSPPKADNGMQANAGYVRKDCNSVYYWKTTFALSSGERQWLADHHVGRLYIRYFDIRTDMEDWDTAIPDATILFNDTVPASLEIVPTVFIDNNVFKRCDMSTYPERMVNRILTMSGTNDVENIHEVQLDCDWTKTTETAWFAFAEAVRKELAGHGITLSATIRLHQLNMAPPPVDRGVLMCYNTGAVRNSATGNSILDANDVALYAKRLKSYDLPLDIAYPTFGWAVWFNANGTFQALLRNTDPGNTNLEQRESNRYTVRNGFYQEGKYLAAGDEVRFEFSDFSEIMDTKRLLEHQLNNYSVILYHLDNKNLSNYTGHEIDKIYAHK